MLDNWWSDVFSLKNWTLVSFSNNLNSLNCSSGPLLLQMNLTGSEAARDWTLLLKKWKKTCRIEWLSCSVLLVDAPALIFSYLRQVEPLGSVRPVYSKGAIFPSEEHLLSDKLREVTQGVLCFGISPHLLLFGAKQRRLCQIIRLSRWYLAEWRPT